MPVLPPPFICAVVSVYDADGPIRCVNGIKVRVAGINARETDGSCRINAPCPTMPHEQAKPIVERLVLHKRLFCQPVGRSYHRVVARCTLPDGRSLSCAIIAAGAGVRWDRYWQQYRMGECR
ncbi:thermonuclease family protein [Sphingomonas sp. 1P08PE]|uniref:thermonuclease family protein n=1 Tax=Sphingomonas sp. 1P08PE TaxID=554122 RepID=UPI00399F2DE0